MHRTLALLRHAPASLLALLAVFGAFTTPSAQAPAQPPVFRISRDVVSIDVIVRDRSGNVVRGLTPADFEIREDGRAQDLLTATYQEVTGVARAVQDTPLLQRLGQPAPAAGSQASGVAGVAGRRLVMLLFDLSAMEPEEIERGVRAATRYVDTQMSSTDLVAIASLTWQLNVLSDFTGDREAVRSVLQGLAPVDVRTGDGGAPGQTDVPPESDAATTTVVATDARLRALRLLADALAPIAQKKALLYFTAGLGNGAQDTPAELRAATTAASRANLAIYPVDTRGLQTVIPNGQARVGSRGGEGLFSGSDVNDQFNDLTASQDTLASMASATGGRLFSGANDVSAAFTRVQRDTASYYLLGYTSSNDARDGRFRRVQVRVRREGLRVESRAGYFAERDFAHMGRTERELQLEEHLAEPARTATLAVEAATGPSHESPDGLTVPLTVVASGFPVGANGKVQFDVLAIVHDEQGRSLARLRDTFAVSERRAGDPSSVTYSSTVVLPPGYFNLVVVVRENESGAIGRAQAGMRVPASDDDFEVIPLSISGRSSVVSESLTVKTAVVDALNGSGARQPFIVGLAIFRDGVRVMDVEMRELSRTTLVLGNTRVEFELPITPGSLGPGTYTYQLTAVDPATGRFSIVRSNLDLP